MDLDAPLDAGPASQSSQRAESPAENIELLSTISKEIPLLLQSAGSALSLLTNARNLDGLAKGSEIPQQSNNLDVRKAAFLEQVRMYYTTLRKLQAGLSEQAAALEDAGIIPTEAPKDDAPGIKNGGLGQMDIGWLNSRSRDVGAEKELETVQEAKEWLVGMREVKDAVMEERPGAVSNARSIEFSATIRQTSEESKSPQFQDSGSESTGKLQEGEMTRMGISVDGLPTAVLIPDQMVVED